jgi:hypothetical protein
MENQRVKPSLLGNGTADQIYTYMMKLFDELNEENFLIYAAKNYNNAQCLDVEEFYDDLSRFKYIKRLLRKYQQSGIIQERLILNHTIILYNVFGIEASNRMIFYKIEEELWPVLKAFLVYLDYLPENDKAEIAMDEYVISVLRKI